MKNLLFREKYGEEDPSLPLWMTKENIDSDVSQGISSLKSYIFLITFAGLPTANELSGIFLARHCR